MVELRGCGFVVAFCCGFVLLVLMLLVILSIGGLSFVRLLCGVYFCVGFGAGCVRGAVLLSCVGYSCLLL